ncbi:hypothetical protein DICSQDRAFT_172479 [Dichomitus squalens LYAD-421 SS1]|uniref:Uncharacterized protein n=1 Tax=Dichomitus squalens (strain LYAD-421) TaxID=732165 RepID=R7STA3_DICSQ|nr:uncharacterized protein DICSQDRAFT_172479 [Dichomitus squalens LYAD-421 SS1]EJF58985.1 hypothetical protein DICSQDRAFT_172479 [Dichomitus squalens LYAD-421 SS1]
MRNNVSTNLAMSGLPWIPEDVPCPQGVGQRTMAGLWGGAELIPWFGADEEEEDELAWLQGEAVAEEDEGEGGDGDGAEGNDDADGEGGVDGAVGSEESSEEEDGQDQTDETDEEDEDEDEDENEDEDETDDVEEATAIASEAYFTVPGPRPGNSALTSAPLNGVVVRRSTRIQAQGVASSSTAPPPSQGPIPRPGRGQAASGRGEPAVVPTAALSAKARGKQPQTRARPAGKENQVGTAYHAGDSNGSEEYVVCPSASAGCGKRRREPEEDDDVDGDDDDDDDYTARAPSAKRKRLPGGSSVNVDAPKKSKRPRVPVDVLDRLCTVMPDAPCPWPTCTKKFQLVQTGKGEGGDAGAARPKCNVTEHFREHVEDGHIFNTNGAIVCPACGKTDKGNTFVRHVKAAHWHARWGCLLTLHGLECSWQGTRAGDVSQHVERTHRGHLDLLPPLPT